MFNLRKLHEETSTKEKTLNFLIENNLIQTTVICDKCRDYMTIQKGGKSKIGYRFRCPRPCRQERSILKTLSLRNHVLKCQKFWSLFIIGPIKLLPTKICIGN